VQDLRARLREKVDALKGNRGMKDGEEGGKKRAREKAPRGDKKSNKRAKGERAEVRAEGGEVTWFQNGGAGEAKAAEEEEVRRGGGGGG
jgi:hypothetical protein